jgi:hypothetical protein
VSAPENLVLWPGIQRYFSEPLTDPDVTVMKRVLAKLIRANGPPLDRSSKDDSNGKRQREHRPDVGLR